MKLKDGVKERTVSTIVEVREGESGYEVKKRDGWSLWVDKKYGVIPKVGDIIILYGKPFSVIQGIQINDKVLFLKSDKQMEDEHEAWIKKTREKYLKEYAELMVKIKDEEPFETIDISGMGGRYECACQLMLRAGMKFLKKNPEFHFDYQQYKNVYGICTTDTPWGKKLDKAIIDAVGGDCSGAIHQAVINHLLFIHKNGYEAWLKSAKERKYKYPSELPKPSFGEES